MTNLNMLTISSYEIATYECLIQENNELSFLLKVRGIVDNANSGRYLGTCQVL